MSGILLAAVGNSYGSAPVNAVAPVVSGTASFGSTLTTTNGTWTGAPAPTFTYQWQRVTTNISGATSSTYTLVAADVGNTIRCVVKATNTIAPSGVTANSNSTASVAAIVPGAPTIGTATAAGATTVTVTYTAPASNGGATITSYTATSSPSGITGTLSQAGSGTITVTGLTTNTAYTFTVTATNSAGTGASSAASNSATPVIVVGQQVYTGNSGSYTWVAPAGVTKVSIVAVGKGYSPYGGGGGLGYKNNVSVTPGNSYNVAVGNPSCFGGATGNTGSYSYGGTYSGDGGGNGGGGSGGGAGGYSGNGGNNGRGAGGAGSGGGGGGSAYVNGSYGQGGGGGGVGLLGQGANGAGGGACESNTYGRGGSGGANGTPPVYRCMGCCGVWYNGGSGGAYGGGAFSATGGGNNGTPGTGAVRIIWPGCSRAFPSTCTGDL